MSTTAPFPVPSQRNPAEIAPTNTYQCADRVWVYRGGAWCAGVVEAVSAWAATVRYRPTSSRGTGVDTLTAEYMQSRTARDPLLDDGLL